MRDAARTLRAHLQDAVEYKKRMRPLKVKLEDGTVKTVLIDDSDTVAQVCTAPLACTVRHAAPTARVRSQVVETIGKKMNLKGWEEFTLKYDDKGASRRRGAVGVANSDRMTHAWLQING